MEDNTNDTLWELGLSNPELRESIARLITKESGGYSIPTRRKSELTGEVEDVHTWAFEEEDPAYREKLTEYIKKVDSLTVGQLAKCLNYSRVYILTREAKGEELTEQEKTLKDIDISLLALFAVLGTGKTIGRRTPVETKEEK